MSSEVAVVDEGFDERIDRAIWKNVGLKSVRQISEDLGIPPEKVLKRKRELLEEVDVLTIQEKRQKLLVELEGMAQDARERAEMMPSEFYAGTVNASVSAIKVMLVELNRASKIDDAKADELNQKRVRELFALMRDVVEVGVLEIAETYKLNEDDLFAVFNRAMVQAAEKRDMQ